MFVRPELPTEREKAAIRNLSKTEKLVELPLKIELIVLNKLPEVKLIIFSSAQLFIGNLNDLITVFLRKSPPKFLSIPNFVILLIFHTPSSFAASTCVS